MSDTAPTNDAASASISASPELVGAPPTASAPASPQSAQRRRFEFTGVGSEYFKIWIVNVLLTIVTLGIYSAWAKVRRLRYFYNNTKFAGSTFDFHGSPIAILKGRAIAVVLILLIQIPYIGLIFLAIYLLGLPWLLYKSFQFNLANSSYRNLRFNFTGTARGAYIALGIPLAIATGLLAIGFLSLFFGGTVGIVVGTAIFVVTLIVFYLMGPYLQYRVYRYYATNAELGNSRFEFHVKALEFYVPYAIAFAVMMVLGVVMSLLVAIVAGVGIGLSDLANLEEAAEEMGMGAAIAMFVVLGIFYFAMLAVAPLIQSLVHNMVWRGTSLSEKRFHADIKVPHYVGVWMLVTFLTIITLGLYRPFAAVKLARLRVEATSWSGAADDMISILRQGNQRATGSEVADLMDVDFGM
jgi:uncharacterized membrane protein YjgN (DUF898 family)